jgi:hypothetical protein
MRTSGKLARNGVIQRLAVGASSGVELVDDLQVAAVEDLGHQPADDLLVGFGHRAPLWS